MGVLGDDPNKQNKPTYTIHQAVASRWNNFITKGLSDDELAKMTDTYTIPSNVNLTTPKINPEILSFLNGQQKTKDSFHENYHRQVAIGMSALGQGLNALLESSMIKNIVKTSSGLQLFISDPIKTSGVDRTQPCLNLPFFAEKQSLCVASALTQYLDVTKTIRPSGKDELFLTYGKPHRIATKQTLSRWVKDTLSNAGIDTSIFQAHSTRHASASLVFRQGISVDVISRTAGWTEKSSCFARFYNRPLSTTQTFANTILASAGHY
nr:unnamed protein product [Callosobruchus analis]